MTELATIDFRHTGISVLTDEKGSWVFPGQLCRNMGIDPNGQKQGIERSHWSEGWTCVTNVQLPGDAQARPQFALHERRFAMWMATITSSRIKDPAARTMVEQYQTNAADVLADWLAQRATPVQRELSKKQILLMALEAEEARETAELAKAAAERQAAILNAHNKALEAREREAQPKVASYEQLMEADGTYSFAEAAKMLPIPMGQNRLFALLREKGLLIEGRRDPYQQYIDRGYFELRAFTYASNHGPVATTTTRITPKGLEYIRKTVIGA